MAGEFGEMTGHGCDVVAYKNSTLPGGDSQDDIVGETLQRYPLRTSEVQIRVEADHARDD